MEQFSLWNDVPLTPGKGRVLAPRGTEEDVSCRTLQAKAVTTPKEGLAVEVVWRWLCLRYCAAPSG